LRSSSILARRGPNHPQKAVPVEPLEPEGHATCGRCATRSRRTSTCVLRTTPAVEESRLELLPAASRDVLLDAPPATLVWPVCVRPPIATTDLPPPVVPPVLLVPTGGFGTSAVDVAAAQLGPACRFGSAIAGCTYRSPGPADAKQVQLEVATPRRRGGREERAERTSASSFKSIGAPEAHVSFVPRTTLAVCSEAYASTMRREGSRTSPVDEQETAKVRPAVVDQTAFGAWHG
jgi:hypothetical protein